VRRNVIVVFEPRRRYPARARFYDSARSPGGSTNARRYTAFLDPTVAFRVTRILSRSRTFKGRRLKTYGTLVARLSDRCGFVFDSNRRVFSARGYAFLGWKLRTSRVYIVGSRARSFEITGKAAPYATGDIRPNDLIAVNDCATRWTRGYRAIIIVRFGTDGLSMNSRKRPKTFPWSSGSVSFVRSSIIRCRSMVRRLLRFSFDFFSSSPKMLARRANRFGIIKIHFQKQFER